MNQIDEMRTEEGDGVAAPKVAEQVLAHLKGEIERLMRELAEQPFWRVAVDPQLDPRLLRCIMAEQYAEIAAYQPDVIEATIALIGQFPRAIPAQKIRTMLVHQAEEWDHGLMAEDDLDGLNLRGVRARWTPTALATAAFWRMLVQLRLPFAYLGALYLFEGLTPIVTGTLKKNLLAHNFESGAMRYVEFHSTEDVKHARIVDHLILDTVKRYPDKADDVLFGFEAFRQVYPLPGWTAAYNRGLRIYESRNS